MELWFTENHTGDVKFSIRVDRQLCSVQSQFQRIDVFHSEEFGRFLVLDGFIMLTEKDEFIYHEMITHVPMAVHPDPKNILVIGAGDGGVVRELAAYKCVENIDLVEIDEEVINVCKEYLPQTACRFDDPRVHIYYQDGLKFIRKHNNEYDIIIVDSTDPFGPGEGLFTKEFYGNCHKALKEDGILVNQHESPFYAQDALAMQKAHKNISEIFEICKVYQAHIPTYPSGHWLFGFASKKYDPVKDLFGREDVPTRYYNDDLHNGAFALPEYVNELLKSVESKPVTSEENPFKTNITFSISLQSEQLDFDLINDLLKVKPTLCQRKGERITTGRLANVDSWHYEARKTVTKHLHFDREVEEEWQVINSILMKCSDLPALIEMGMYLCLCVNTWSFTFDYILNPDIMREISEYKIPLKIDVISWGGVEAGEDDDDKK